MSRPRKVLALACATGVAAVAGCGGGAARDRAPSAGPPPSPRPASTTATTTQPSHDPAAKARVQRAHERLLDAYAPATEYMNFFVSEWELQARQLGSPADARAAARQYSSILVRVRRNLRALPASGPGSAVRRELLAAVNQRTRAMRAVQVLLAAKAAGRPEPGAATTWGGAFDASIGHAREATNALQRERDDAGLEPAPEDSLR